MTEISFLLDLLLNHKLPKLTKDVVLARIREVEANPQPHFQQPSEVHQAQPQRRVGITSSQAPSTRALMMKHGDIPFEPLPPPETPIPVAVIAQTPQTAMAMQLRNEAIGIAIKGEPEKGRISPRKW